MKKQAQPQKKPKKTSVLPARIGMFVFIFVAVAMMGLRVQEMVSEIAKGTAPAAITPAKAETATKEVDKPSAPEAAQPPAQTEPKKEEPPKAEQKPEELKKEEVKPDAPKADEAKPADTSAAPTEEPENFSEAEVNILKKLADRRKELEKRAREMDEREALLKVTEQRVDKKIDDLKAIQEQLRQAIGDATADQKAKADSLVKIYETMKPKEAARIFDALDMQVLLAVIGRMKETKVAPILATMDPNKAKQVTAALMEKKPLPTIPQ